MRTKIYKWTATDEKHYFDILSIDNHLFSLRVDYDSCQIGVYFVNNASEPIDEKDVPENVKKIVYEYISDPLFEIELEKYIQKWFDR